MYNFHDFEMHKILFDCNTSGKKWPKMGNLCEKYCNIIWRIKMFPSLNTDCSHSNSCSEAQQARGIQSGSESQIGQMSQHDHWTTNKSNVGQKVREWRKFKYFAIKKEIFNNNTRSSKSIRDSRNVRAKKSENLARSHSTWFMS